MTELFFEVSQNPAFFYLAALLVSIASSAFGVSGAILIPLAALYFGAKEGVAIVTLYFLFQNLTKLAFFKEHVEWKVTTRMVAWAMPGVLVGAALLVYLPVGVFEKILGVGMLGFIVADVLKLRYFGRITSSGSLMPLWGALYGLFSGALGSGNVVKGPFFVSIGLLKESYVSTYAATSLFMNIPKLGIYTLSGIITAAVFAKSLPFLLISILGTWLGKKILRKVSGEVFYYATMAVFFISAISLML